MAFIKATEDEGQALGPSNSRVQGHTFPGLVAHTPQFQGNSYHGWIAKDNARFVAGNVYGDVHLGEDSKGGKERVLESLWFDGMHRHHDRDMDAHPGTYNWIFDEEATTFQRWLRSSDGVFWVHGKAGSGKSTLMKYISEHSRTKEILYKWAAGNVIIAQFFAWNAGTELEKSQKGLLRSLLHQILRLHPNLIPEIAPERYNSDASTNEHRKPWGRRELSQSLRTVVQSGNLNSRFCFFIDGLDEFEGEYPDLIEDLDHLATLPMVKLCVSSRPWPEFRAAYGYFADRQFVLQELTRLDMEKYIKAKLEEHPPFVDLSKRDYHALELVQGISDKAQGVFLWVILAVKALKRGVGRGDSVRMLWDRLHSFPPDLDGFLERIFNNIELVHQKYAARALILVLHYQMTALDCSFIEEDVQDETFAIRTAVQPMPWSELLQRVEHGSNSVNRWCKDLLEVPMVDHEKAQTNRSRSDFAAEIRAAVTVPGFSGTLRSSYDSFPTSRGTDELTYNNNFSGHPAWTLKWPHRTIRDFVHAKEANGTLSALAGPAFQSSEACCRFNLQLAKRASNLQNLYHASRAVMHVAHGIDGAHRGIRTQLINELDRVGQRFWQNSNRQHWSVGMVRDERANFALESPSFVHTARAFLDESKNSNIVSFAIFFGVHSFVIEELSEHPSRYTRENIQHLLCCAVSVEGLPIAGSSMWSEDVIVRLLQSSGDLNESGSLENTTYTPWQRFLAYNFYWLGSRRLWRFLRKVLSDMFVLLLKYGADPNAELDIQDLKAGIDVDCNACSKALEELHSNIPTSMSVIKAIELILSKATVCNTHVSAEDIAHFARMLDHLKVAAWKKQDPFLKNK